MGPETKGRGWFGKIYNKLETILSKFPFLEENIDAILSNEEPIITNDESQITNTLIPHKFFAGISPVVSRGEESVEEDRDDLYGEVVFTVLAALGIFADDDSNLNDLLATKIPDVLVQDNVANMRSSKDDVINGKSDVAPLDINALYHIEFGEDPLYLDENAMHVKTIAPQDTNAFYGMKFKSFKKNILDALTSKRRRKKEYEQLAIRFGDVDMSSDLVIESKQVETKDSKSSQLHESEDSQWVLV